MIALTGSIDQIEALKKAYGVYVLPIFVTCKIQPVAKCNLRSK